jgi:FkbM family methyltransferase
MDLRANAEIKNRQQLLDYDYMKKFLKSAYLAVPFKKPLFSIIRKVWVPPKSIYRYLYFRGIFQVQVGEKHFLIQHYGYDIETDIFWLGLSGGWEKISLTIWIELCKQASMIIDVGANTGIYGLVAKSVQPNANVYCIEPVQRIYRKLVNNCNLNHYDIRCLRWAASNYDGEGIIYDLPTEHVYKVTLNKNTNPSFPVSPCPVRTMRLATMIKEENISKIDLIKIDVESHEPDVLEGMGEYLPSMRPTILLEIWNNQVGHRVEKLVKGLDYCIYATDEKSPFHKVNKITNTDGAGSYSNYLLCEESVAKYLKLPV